MHGLTVRPNSVSGAMSMSTIVTHSYPTMTKVIAIAAALCQKNQCHSSGRVDTFGMICLIFSEPRESWVEGVAML